MTLTLKHIANKNIKFFYIYLKIEDFHFVRFLRCFKDRLYEFFFLDFFFFFRKKKNNFSYIKIIFFFFNILEVETQILKDFNTLVSTEVFFGNFFVIKQASILTIKQLNYLLKKKLFKYTLKIFDLTGNFDTEHIFFLSLIKVKKKKRIFLKNSYKNTNREFLLPIKNFSSSFFKKPINILYYLIKIYFFHNDKWRLKKILKYYRGEFDNFEKIDNIGPRTFFYKYLKKNYDQILNKVYNFYWKKFIIHDQIFNYFLYVFINAKKKKILKYFKFDEPNIYLEVYVPSV